MPALVLLSLAALVACAAVPTPSGSGPDEPTARLGVVPGDPYTVAAVAEGSGSGTYSLLVVRTGAAGTSRSRQGGAFTVSGRDTLSVSRVNAAAGDSLRAELTVEWASGAVTQDAFEVVVGEPQDG